ncbi:MAG TPA: hypothetical protein VF665_03040 [Longimicrobium sp.]|jgi:hypothetical protein|uniref:hypothetical protein n=1 Tax=Longimicrobium sp. TaxID=2029185 RepID=UPI002EDB2819
MSENEQIQEQAQAIPQTELDETELETVAGGTSTALIMPAVIVGIVLPQYQIPTTQE